MVLESVFRKIDFVNRYKKICEDHNDFANSMSGTQTKVYARILQKIDSSAVYLSKDKSFKSTASFGEFTLELVLTLHSGHVQAHLNYLKNEDWLMYNRFDGYAEELDSDFDREKYNLPKYTSETELEAILKEIFSIYEDIKKEVSKEVA
jgi:hypothetical protein